LSISQSEACDGNTDCTYLTMMPVMRNGKIQDLKTSIQHPTVSAER